MANTKFPFNKTNELINILALFLSSLFATFLLTNNAIIFARAANNSIIEHSSQYCSITLYPQLCHSTISSSFSSSNFLSIKDIVDISLNVAIDAAKKNHKNILKLSKKMSINFNDCVETTDKTLIDLYKVVEDLREYPKKKSLVLYADDLKTFLSSAITNQETCLDGFSDNKLLPAGKRVLKLIEIPHRHVTKLCSNVLALVQNMTHTDLLINYHKSLAVRDQYPHHHQNIDSFLQPQADHDPKIVLFSSDITDQDEKGKNRGREDLEEGSIKWPEWMAVSDQRLLKSSSEAEGDVVVAADGSGDFLTVSEAVAAAPNKSSERYIIRIKEGVYRENVEVPSYKKNIMFWGDGRFTTIITASRSVGGGSTTFNSATVAVVGDNFSARDITFQNTAGAANHQAVALRVGSDHSAFYRCGILAYQDTLYVHSNRQFFVNCVVAGTVDFIFGNAAVVIQKSILTPRRPDQNQKNMVTAQGRTDPNQNTGIVIQKCTIKATTDLEPAIKEFPSFLGRPWKEYARVVVMETNITNVINPEGWAPWNGDFALKTLFFAEYDNNGAGADTSDRVKWSTVIDAAEAEGFTAGSFIDGADWLPATDFPYQLGLN